jgi:hypothetical protein
MAEQFNATGLHAACFVGDTMDLDRTRILKEFREGSLNFLFTVDVLSEGADIPEVDTVLFLRPTDSLTVFLQQLGRGLRLSPGKECLTVLDFVGHLHRRYRVDRKFKALLRKERFNIVRELEAGFPNLPAGCNIRLEKVAREYVLQNIKTNLATLRARIIEDLETFTSETQREVTFKEFIAHHGYEPLEVLSEGKTWTELKATARLAPMPTDPDLDRLRTALVKIAFMSGRVGLAVLQEVLAKLLMGKIDEALTRAGTAAVAIHYQMWGKKGSEIQVASLEESFAKLASNPSILRDSLEVIDSVRDRSRILSLNDGTPFEVHDTYSNVDIQALMGAASIKTPGQSGVGVFHFKEQRTYALLVTFQKTENEFSPSTMYADYPMSLTQLHWESQSTTAADSATGQNLIHHAERGYTILVFAREKKKHEGITLPFTYLGKANLLSHHSERPIKIVWRLEHSMPAVMFERCRKGG